MTMTIAEATATLTAPGQIFEVGDQTFLVYEDERMTFEEHFRAVARLATKLVDNYGVKKGDRVAIAMRNFPEWAIAFWAAAVAGAVVVPLNAWWTGEELAFGLADSGSTILFADAEREERLRSHWGELAGLRAVIVARSEGGVDPGHERFADILGDVPADGTLP